MEPLKTEDYVLENRGRVRQLERRLRSLAIATAAFAAVTVLGILAALTALIPRDVVRAEHVVITDSLGAMRASLGTSSEGDVFLDFLNADGTMSLSLGFDSRSGNGALQVCDGNGVPIILLSGGEDGAVGTIDLYNGGRVNVRSRDTTIVATVQTSAANAGLITVCDAQGLTSRSLTGEE
jgi:hypothetical protein